MNIYRSAGLAVGVFVGIIVAVIILRLTNRNRSVKTEYDEMQKKVRGDGYRIAFYTVIIYEAVMCLLSGAVELPAEPIVVHFMPIIIGVIVQASYCIWKHAYVGLNTRMNRYLLFMAVVAVINIGVGVMNCLEGNMVVDGIIQAPAVNLLCGAMCVILGVVGAVRKAADRGGDE